MDAQQIQGLLLPVGFIVIFYFLAIRPQKKRDKQITEMRNSLKVGDEIITIGGIIGKVLKVKEDILTIEVGSTKTRLNITKWAVGSVIDKNGPKSSRKEELKEENLKDSIEDTNLQNDNEK